MSSIGNHVSLPNFADVSQGVTLKKNINKAEITSTLNEIQSTKTISKEQFKTLSKGIEGGEKTLGEMLKTIMPENDIKKLKDFSVSKMFSSDKDVKVSISDEKMASVSSGFEKIINKTKNTGEQLPNSVTFIKNSIPKLLKNGDTISKTGFSEANVSASIGATSKIDDPILSNILCLTGTELGAGVGAKIGGSVSVSATNMDGKIKLSFEGRFTIGGEAEAKASIAGAGKSVSAEGSKAYVKKTNYTFNSLDDAKKFLENKGVGFTPTESKATLSEGHFVKKEKGGWETETNKTLDAGYKIVQKSSKGGSISELFGNKSLSKQVLSVNTVSSNNKAVKTFSLDTSSGLIVTKKQTGTQLSIVEKHGAISSGNFSLELDLNKIKNTADRNALVQKLVGRMEHIVSKVDNITVDKKELKAYLEGTIDKLIDKRDKFFSNTYTSSSGTEKTGKLHDKSQARELNASLGFDTGLGSTSLNVEAKWGSMIKIEIPLEVETPSDRGVKPKLKVGDQNDHLVQVVSSKGGSIGAGVELGKAGLAAIEAGIKVGVESSSAFKLIKTQKKVA